MSCFALSSALATPEGSPHSIMLAIAIKQYVNSWIQSAVADKFMSYSVTTTSHYRSYETDILYASVAMQATRNSITIMYQWHRDDRVRAGR